MLGRSAGIHEPSRIQDPLEQYYYLSAEKDLLGGKGPWKHGIKYYSWLQKGVRVFESDPLQQEYNRLRYGIRTQGDARNINSITYGIQYLFTPKLKLAFNFIDLNVSASP